MTVADLKRVASKYLTAANRTVVDRKPAPAAEGQEGVGDEDRQAARLRVDPHASRGALARSRPRRSRCRRSCRLSAPTSRCPSRRSRSRSCRTASPSGWSSAAASRAPRSCWRCAAPARRPIPKDAEGITELLADTLKEGTATRSSRAIAEELQGVGAEIDASGGADALYVTAGGLGIGRAEGARGDGRRRPQRVVPRRRGGARQGQRAAGAAGARVDAGVPGPEGARPRHLRRPPVPHRRRPRRRRCEAATAAQLKQEHARRFQPDRALLVVVGEFDAAAVQAALARHFGPGAAPGEAPRRRAARRRRRQTFAGCSSPRAPGPCSPRS